MNDSSNDYFSTRGATALRDVPPGSAVHVCGVCGVAMAQAAVVLSDAGYRVTGSDREYYEPMASFLRKSSVECRTGYDPAHVPPDAALVVIGNAAGRSNPEVVEVERRRLPYTFFPKLLRDAVIDGKRSVVVSGTHGKSTTTALAASVLVRLGADPSYFIGAEVGGLPTSLKRGGGDASVVEGDEYDSAFFAKVPKFSFYDPDVLVVTSIEFDHADIYRNVDEIRARFDELVRGMRPDGVVLACVDGPGVLAAVSEWARSSDAGVVTYGTAPGCDVRVASRAERPGGFQEVRLESARFGDVTFRLPLAGGFSALNAAAVYASCRVLGHDAGGIAEALAAFPGLKRRQQVRYDRGGTVLVEDFAHHPTAVRETLSGLLERYPGREIIAVFEPRSNTSRRRVFQSAYVGSFGGAARVLLCRVAARPGDEGLDLLSADELAASVAAAGVPAEALPDPDAVLARVMETAGPRSVVLLMSNGSFGGLPAKLEARLVESEPAGRGSL